MKHFSTIINVLFITALFFMCSCSKRTHVYKQGKKYTKSSAFYAKPMKDGPNCPF